jgi:hypothetical protein
VRIDRSKKTRTATRRISILAAAVTATTGIAYAGTDTVPGGNSTSLRNTTPGVTAVVPTVSLSGSTAIRNFTISPGMTLLNTTPGSSITLGPVGNEITYTLGGSASLQFAQKNFNTADVTAGTIQSHSGLRIEWHEQGAVEGMLELADGQINDSIYGNLIYNPTTGNATYVNQNKFGGTGSAVFPPANLGGHQLNNNPNDNTRDAQAQNAVQMSIADTPATQGFAKGGVAFNNGGAYSKTPTDNGYGKGNPALPVGTLGSPGVRFQLLDENALNMVAGQPDPTGGGNYGTGAWNTAGVGNLNSKRLAITATLFVANPGTGLAHINRTDAQWLQMTGRLKNGADFNMTTRDAGSGTRNVAATNTGVDASWAVGENDGGNGNSLTGGTDQTAVGPGITFSNKTAGGGQLRPVVQRSRMAIGTLSMSDSIGSVKGAVNTPLRGLDYRDDADDLNNNSNGNGFKNWSESGGQPVFTTGDLASGTFIRASATSISNGGYAIYQNEQYVTVRRPDADYATDKVKGDNTGHDVQDVRDNVLNSVVTFGSGASVATPADALIDNSLILPQMMLVNKPIDGLNQSDVNASRDVALRNAFLADARAGNFNPDDPSTIKQGSSAKYGANVAHVVLNPDGTTSNIAPLGGAIDITANNYFFGDFKRDNADPNTGNREVRDFSDLAVAQKAQAALKLGGSTNWDDGGDLNNRVVSDGGGFLFTADMAFTPTKGDLIALGDYNSDGSFDGKDLYLMAHGSALADNNASTTLSGGSNAFADKVRNGVLRKNAALDLLDGVATVQQKIDARANATNDPAGVNAFNKRDVNRDGLVNFVDAVTSDKFFGKSYRNLDDQLAATGDVRVGDTLTPFSLVDAELNDTGNIDQSDLDVINPALGGFGSETWSGTLVKSGAGTISTAYVPGGVMKVFGGATLLINAGAVNVGGTADMFTDNTGTPTNGNHVAVINNSTTSFNITAGGKSILTLTGAGSTTVAAGASLTADYVRQSALTVNGNVNIRPNGNNASVVGNLTVTGRFDLADNDLIVHNGAGVEGLVASGRNGGNWSGNGIVTTSASGSLTGLGVALASQAKAVGATDTAVWNGQTVTGSDTLVMYTYGGDANLDGKLNVDDYGRIDSNIGLGNGGWYNGDFNYDGKVNVDDYGIIDSNIGIQGPPLGSAASLSAVTAVPEPGSAGLFLSALALPLARVMRRRRR